ASPTAALLAVIPPDAGTGHRRDGRANASLVHLLEGETRRPIGEGASRKRTAGVLHDPLEVCGRVTRRIDVVVGVDDPVLAARCTLSRRPARAESSACADGREHAHDRTPRRGAVRSDDCRKDPSRPPITFGHLFFVTDTVSAKPDPVNGGTRRVRQLIVPDRRGRAQKAPRWMGRTCRFSPPTACVPRPPPVFCSPASAPAGPAPASA